MRSSIMREPRNRDNGASDVNGSVTPTRDHDGAPTAT